MKKKTKKRAQQAKRERHNMRKAILESPEKYYEELAELLAKKEWPDNYDFLADVKRLQCCSSKYIMNKAASDFINVKDFEGLTEEEAQEMIFNFSSYHYWIDFLFRPREHRLLPYEMPLNSSAYCLLRILNLWLYAEFYSGLKDFSMNGEDWIHPIAKFFEDLDDHLNSFCNIDVMHSLELRTDILEKDAHAKEYIDTLSAVLRDLLEDQIKFFEDILDTLEYGCALVPIGKIRDQIDTVIDVYAKQKGEKKLSKIWKEVFEELEKAEKKWPKDVDFEIALLNILE